MRPGLLKRREETVLLAESRLKAEMLVPVPYTVEGPT